MFILPSMKSGMKPTSGMGLPSYSHEFVRSNSEYLSMSNSDFGIFDLNTLAVSLWFKRSVTNWGQTIIRKFETSTSNESFHITDSFNRPRVIVGGGDGRFTASTTVTDTTTWHHLLAHIDIGNPVSTERLKIWLDGVPEVASNYKSPTLPMKTNLGSATIGASSAGASAFGGKIYQLAIFSGYLPTISEVYASGSPMDVSAVSGVFILPNPDVSLTEDYVLAADWADNNTVNLSVDIPT